ncbi:TetR/AcrR family transcriptional regulator [Alteraurantiacibacter palmitatis]|uniref:TetR/AcrR family transcriptional regulator n=1 Tax=Alteraurantiacibacter palmitatis TaxID=2054628 RepID=A0ABV7EB74_9SPHN
MEPGRQEAGTREKLLAAAERIVVERGLTGLSVRRVGEAAGMNPTLVTYHFKGVGGLLDELCRCNLDPVLADWQAVRAGDPLDTVLEAWLRPMQRPAAFTPDGRALVVLDEIAAHGTGALRQQVLAAMEQFIRNLREALAPHCPHLSPEELRARLRFISGAVLGPPPRSHGAPVLDDGRALDDLVFLLRFARAALAN